MFLEKFMLFRNLPYICDGSQMVFISSVILNPLLWPIAGYYVFNFSKLQKLQSDITLEKINENSKSENLSTNEEENTKTKEFQERKKKSRNLLIFSSYIMASWNLAANFLLVYCISHYLIKLGNKKSLFIAAGVVGFLSFSSVVRIVAGCIRKVIEEKSIKLQKAASHGNEPRRTDHGLLLSLQLASLYIFSFILSLRFFAYSNA